MLSLRGVQAVQQSQKQIFVRQGGQAKKRHGLVFSVAMALV
jgi:hypothetical protein